MEVPMDDIFALIGIDNETTILPGDDRFEMLDLTVKLACDGGGGVRIGRQPGYNYLRIGNPRRFIIYYTDPTFTGYEILEESHALSLIVADVVVELDASDQSISAIVNHPR
jgi:hypothetical protein